MKKLILAVAMVMMTGCATFIPVSEEKLQAAERSIKTRQMDGEKISDQELYVEMPAKLLREERVSKTKHTGKVTISGQELFVGMPATKVDALLGAPVKQYWGKYTRTYFYESCAVEMWHMVVSDIYCTN